MKNRIRNLAAILALAGGIAGLNSGCSHAVTGQSTSEYVDDAAITAKVNAAFVKDPVVKALRVHVDTQEGTVRLNGFVDTPEEKRRAEMIARSVPDVTDVQNQLTVKTDTP